MPHDRRSQLIIEALDHNQLDTAHHLLHEWGSEAGADAEHLFLSGRLSMKRQRWGEAISLFTQADRLAPQGPAAEYLEMLTHIMDFYNKDMYNP